MIMYVGSQLLSTLLTPTTPDRNQQMLMYGLPLVFAIFILLYEFPAGLLVYWITTNLWTVGQGYLLRKKLGPIMPIKPTTSDSGSRVHQGHHRRDRAEGARSFSEARRAARWPKSAPARGRHRRASPAAHRRPRRAEEEAIGAAALMADDPGERSRSCSSASWRRSGSTRRSRSPTTARPSPDRARRGPRPVHRPPRPDDRRGAAPRAACLRRPRPARPADRRRRRGLPRAPRGDPAPPGRPRRRGRAAPGPPGRAGRDDGRASDGSSTSTCASTARCRRTPRATSPTAISSWLR